MRSKEAIVTVFTGVAEAVAPPMTAALTFDPRAVAWGRAGSDREGSLYSWTPVLNPLLSHREGGTFPMDLWA